jgi:2-oxo-3-hexenedioate decarboxylase
MSDNGRAQDIAAEALAALDHKNPLAPFTARLPDFTLDEAYAVLAAQRALREQRGERVVGRKIGFTNRTIWPQYNVNGPIWGYIYDSTFRNLSEVGERFLLAPFSEPQIEPEIVLCLKAAPQSGMDESALLGCLAWIAPGFEIVQSIFPGWRFKAPDTVAGAGLHGALLIGERMPVPAATDRLVRELVDCTIILRRNGETVDQGRGANALGSPLSAILYLMRTLAQDRHNPPLAAGEIITTGTLTRAFPVTPGESWTAAVSGIALRDISVSFC